jgi:hypothetical protein
MESRWVAEMRPKLILATQDGEPTPEWEERVQQKAREEWEWYQKLMAVYEPRERENFR